MVATRRATVGERGSSRRARSSRPAIPSHWPSLAPVVAAALSSSTSSGASRRPCSYSATARSLSIGLTLLKKSPAAR